MARKILLCFFAFFLGSCHQTPSSSKPLCLVSIAPYLSFAKEIAGQEFDVKTIVPSNANPHSFEPTSQEVKEMTRAQIWFRIGEPFEEKILPFLKRKNPNLQIVDLREGIDLIYENHANCHQCAQDHLDRHIWLSPERAKKQVEKMASTLIEKYPDQKEIFETHLATLVEKLTSLDQEIRKTLHAKQQTRALLTSHPAFAYFCKDYGFIQLSVEYEGKDPRPKHLEDILTQARLHSTKMALALPQYNNKGTLLIAKKLDIPLQMVDPYSPHYFETLKTLTQIAADSYAD